MLEQHVQIQPYSAVTMIRKEGRSTPLSGLSGGRVLTSRTPWPRWLSGYVQPRQRSADQQASLNEGRQSF